MAAQIRLADPEADAVSIARIYAPFCRDTPVTFDIHAPWGDEMAARIDRILKAMPWLVCENHGDIVGYAYAAPHRHRAAYRWSVEVSVYVDERHRGQGVGRALYTSLFSILGLQGFCNAYAGITLPNEVSVGLHESLGFQPVGIYRKVGFKLGQWHDVGWWELALRDRPSRPDAPRDLPQACRSPDWTSHLQKGLSLLRL